MIHLENIDKSVGKKQILSQFFLDIQAGELIAIIGKSGSGKTSLLNLIGLIDGDYTGNYTLCGQTNIPVNSSKAQRMIREKISYLFQHFALIDNETVEYNLLMALHYTRDTSSEKKKKVLAILERVGLADTLKQKVAELSGGEQQRIAIARALLKPSEIILADEPTGSLDQENREIVLRFLLEMHQARKTVLIVTHDPYVAATCQRTIHL